MASLSGALPFDAVCTLRRARDHQQRPVILAEDAQSRRSKHLEASTASHDEEVGLHVGGVLENRAGCGPRRHLDPCVEAARNCRHDRFQGSLRVFEDVCAVFRYHPPGRALKGVGCFESFDGMHHRQLHPLGCNQLKGASEDIL